MMRRKIRVGIGLVAAGLLAGMVSSRGASAQPPDPVPVPAPADVSIRRITLSGPACPEGTATVNLFDNNRAFVIVFNEFRVEAGPGTTGADSSKHCVATIELDFPAGYTWTVSQTAYRGNAILGSSVNARFRSRLSFPGQRSVSGDVVLLGPQLSDFELLARYDLRTWAPCGRTVPMTATATAQVDNTANPTQSGIITVEQQDGTFDMVFNLNWGLCPSPVIRR